MVVMLLSSVIFVKMVVMLLSSVIFVKIVCNIVVSAVIFAVLVFLVIFVTVLKRVLATSYDISKIEPTLGSYAEPISDRYINGDLNY